jgi:hypothetical protein
MAYISSVEPFDDFNLWETEVQNSLATVFRGDMKLGCEKNTAFLLVSEHEDNGDDDLDDDEGEAAGADDDEDDEEDEDEEEDFDDDFDEDFDDDEEEDDDDESKDDLEIEE